MTPTTDRQKAFHQLAVGLKDGELTVAQIRHALQLMVLPMPPGRITATDICREDGLPSNSELVEAIDHEGVRRTYVRYRWRWIREAGLSPFVVLCE